MSYNNNPQFFSSQPQQHIGATHQGDFFSFGNNTKLNSNSGVQPQVINQPNPFATLVSPRPQPQVINQPNPFATVISPQTQTNANPFATVTNVAKPNPFATVVTPQPHQPSSVNPLETREYLEGRIRELELIYKDLLEMFRKLQEENAYLRSELSKKDGGLSQSHQELEMKLQQQQEQFLVANKSMRSHLENTKAQYEQEKKKLIADQVAFAKNSINQYLFRFDDAQFPGNIAANGEDVLQGTVKLKECYDGLLGAIEQGSDIVGPSQRLANHMQKLLEDAKGLSNRIDDPELKIQLMEGTRNLTRLTSKLLSDGQEMIGRRPNGQEMNEMRSRQNNFNHTASNMNNAIKNSGKKGIDSLDSLAEQELKNASRIIAEAAESLRKQAAQHKREEEERIRQQMLLGFDISEIDRKGSNVGAIALGVTEAAQMLIDSAAAAQQERVERGIEAANNNQSYHVDPMWAEGLISAAKAVASSMRVLVGSANNAIKGNVDEASLVSCCRAVAAHTGKLQISSKVKADRDSKAQVQMDKAAKMVKDTTNDLVTETKRVAAFEEVDIGIKVKETEVGNIRAEMELEGCVSRFRADVDKANQRLYDVRRGMYGEANLNEEKKKATTVSKPVNSTYKPLASALVDTTSIASPFGKSVATSQPALSPSFANFSDMTDAEEEVLPKYMQSKLTIKDDGGSKIDQALKAKKELEIKPRPLHLQHDLNQGSGSQQNTGFSPQNNLPPQQNTGFPPQNNLPPQNTGFSQSAAFSPQSAAFSPQSAAFSPQSAAFSPQNNLPPQNPPFQTNEAPMEWDSFIANQLEAQNQPEQDANPFFGGQANDNPFVDANPFLSPPSQPRNSSNPFF